MQKNMIICKINLNKCFTVKTMPMVRKLTIRKSKKGGKNANLTSLKCFNFN